MMNWQNSSITLAPQPFAYTFVHTLSPKTSLARAFFGLPDSSQEAVAPHVRDRLGERLLHPAGGGLELPPPGRRLLCHTRAATEQCGPAEPNRSTWAAPSQDWSGRIRMVLFCCFARLERTWGIMNDLGRLQVLSNLFMDHRFIVCPHDPYCPPKTAPQPASYATKNQLSAVCLFIPQKNWFRSHR